MESPKIKACCDNCKYRDREVEDLPCRYCEGHELFEVPDQVDSVNHPKHYCREGAMECFDEFVLIYGKEAAIHACLFNIHKYRYRAADKNGSEDINKSDWYVRKLAELKCENE